MRILCGIVLCARLVLSSLVSFGVLCDHCAVVVVLVGVLEAHHQVCRGACAAQELHSLSMRYTVPKHGLLLQNTWLLLLLLLPVLLLLVLLLLLLLLLTTTTTTATTTTNTIATTIAYSSLYYPLTLSCRRPAFCHLCGPWYAASPTQGKSAWKTQCEAFLRFTS